MMTNDRLPICAAVLLLGACASNGGGKPPPTPLQLAQTAVARADEARVGDYAGQQMSDARARLSEAREANAAAQTGKDSRAARRARQLAEEASVDVELATAKAQAARVQAAVFALQQQLGLIAPPQVETYTDPYAAELPQQPLPDAGVQP